MAQPTPSVHIEILEPRDRAQVPAGHAVLLRASASAGAEDLGADIRWRSSRDGFLGQGGEITVQLTEGRHKLRAAVRLRAGQLDRSGPSRSQTSKARSRTSEESRSDSDDAAKDVVTVNAVPVDYPGGDT